MGLTWRAIESLVFVSWTRGHTWGLSFCSLSVFLISIFEDRPQVTTLAQGRTSRHSSRAAWSLVNRAAATQNFRNTSHIQGRTGYSPRPARQTVESLILKPPPARRHFIMHRMCRNALSRTRPVRLCAPPLVTCHQFHRSTNRGTQHVTKSLCSSAHAQARSCMVFLPFITRLHVHVCVRVEVVY